MYSGTSSLSTSTGNVDQVVGSVAPPTNPVADAGGPYTVAEGTPLTLDGSASSPAAFYEWDLDGDSQFDDATGVSPTITWAALEALGIDDGPAMHQVGLRVTLNALTATATAPLTVTTLRRCR